MATAPKAKAPKAAEKPADAATDFAKDAMEAMFNYPKFEVPELLRSFVEQGMQQTREAYARVKTAAEEATDMLEDSVETSRSSVREVQFKALDMVKSNTDASFELMRQLLTVTSPADAMQVQAEFARERYEAFVDYSKGLQDLMSKAGTEAAKPAKAMFEKAMTSAKAA